MTREAEPNSTFIAACQLVAAGEAARRCRAGEDIPDPARYVRIRAERLSRDYAALWHSLPDPDPFDFARGIEPSLGRSVEAAPQPTKVIDGVTHRFITGTGWCPPLPCKELA